MTDITELAQREKFEAWAEECNALPWGYLKKRRIYTGFYSEHTYSSLWAVWKAAGAELVEALEKAQRANAAQDDHINQQQDRIESLEKKNAELGKYAGGLESFRTAYMEWSDKTDWVQKDKRFDVLKPWGKHRADVLKEYIQHLESRTVMLERQLVDHVDEESLITIKAAPAMGSLPKTGEVQNTNYPAIPDGYVMVPKDLLSELRDWAHPEIEKYCEMWEGRRDSEFPALRKVIADADSLLAAAPQEVK
ncbi:TPA: hypothetical protein ND790_003192 [Klebsiella pneumoniae]|nr:hypothetical protein [Klebsiella pneumoniae]